MFGGIESPVGGSGADADDGAGFEYPKIVVLFRGSSADDSKLFLSPELFAVAYGGAAGELFWRFGGLVGGANGGSICSWGV